MKQTLDAKEHSLAKVFNGDFSFRIPSYQRPYSWRQEHVDELLDDLRQAAASPDEAPYFLGSIVVVKEDDATKDCEVVDGQQRLTTLTILLCVLRELTPNYGVHLDPYIRQKANPVEGTVEHLRLSLRPRDRSFFRDRIQSPDAIPEFVSTSHKGNEWTPSRKLLYENTVRLHEKLKDLSEPEREKLAEFVVQKCYLVVVTATNLNFAYRIFSVLNNRGLPLSPTDILKAKILGDLEDEAEYTTKWEDIEDDLGRDRFRDLFAHIRMIRVKTKLRATLHDDFEAKVLKGQAGHQFIDQTLIPCSESYRRILDATIPSSTHADRLNHHVSHLGRLDNFDWIPPAMAYLRSRPQDESRLQFFRDLERLAYFLFVTRTYENQRINRYAEVLGEIEAGDNLGSEGSRLQLTAAERTAFKERLDEDVYSRGSRVMRPLLLKLDSTLVEPNGGAVYNQRVITVEHVLPQTPPEDSQWRHWFTNEERETWTHKLANLVLLSRRRNTAASNRPFREKIDTYLMRKGATPFRLTQEIRDESEWTPQVLQRRQRELIDKLSDEWRLQGPGFRRES